MRERERQSLVSALFFLPFLKLFFVLQFVNKASERLLGYRYEEMLGKNLAEIITCENFALMDQQLQRGREFEGNLNCKRKFNDTITINCRIVPFCATGK